MKSLSAKTFQCGVTVQGLTTLSGTVYLTALTNTATWDYVVVGTTAQGQLYTRTYAQLMSDITSGIGLSGYVPTSRTLTINGVSYDLTANRSWTISTVDYTSRLQHQVKAGVAINKGQAVYVTSADGTNMIVGLASNASEATSSKTMGLLDATVSINGFANVVTEGLLAGLDTSTAGTEGDPVWLGTGGNLIYGLINKPSAPAHLVFIGIVTRKNSNNGEIFVKVQNGFELNEIHDVDLKTIVPVNGHILGFDGTLWVNKTIAGWLGYTPANASGTTNYLSKFTGSTTLGNSLVYDNGTNVGIGTTSPSTKLHVVGASIIANNSSINPDTYGNTVIAGAIGTVGGWGLSSAIGGNAGTGHSWAIGTNGDNLYMGYSNGSSSNSMLTFLQVDDSTRNVFLVPQAGNVGIGTASPSYKLDVSGALRATGTVYSDNGSLAGALNLGQVVSIGSSFGSYANLIFTMHNGGGFSDVLKLQGNGNVGIGTTSPDSKLHIEGTTTGSGSGADAIVHIKQNGGWNGNEPWALYVEGYSYLNGFRVNAYDTQRSLYSSAGELGFAVSGNSPISFTQNTSDYRMYIASGGNIGIGTTTPNEKLTVNGKGYFIPYLPVVIGGASAPYYGPNIIMAGDIGSTQGAIRMQSSYDGTGYTALVFERATNAQAYNQDPQLLTFSETMRISGNGNVGIGTASPSTKLDVNGVITATGGNSTQWNTAYSWGNHSSAGYVPQARTLTINGTTYDLSANRSWTIATTTPGGADTQFQYNSSGSLAGASALTYNSTTNRVGVNQASPGYDFDVNGQVRVQDKLRVGTVNSGNGVVHMSSTATINPSATTIVWSQNVSVGMCAFIEYYILNNNTTTDQRAGTIMVTWNQSGTPTIAHTETTTPDIGSTTPVIFTSSLVGSDARINAVNSSSAPYTIVMSYKYF